MLASRALDLPSKRVIQTRKYTKTPLYCNCVMMILGYLMRFKLSRGEWIHVVGPCRGPSAGWGWQELPSHALWVLCASCYPSQSSPITHAALVERQQGQSGIGSSHLWITATPCVQLQKEGQRKPSTAPLPRAALQLSPAHAAGETALG